MSASRRFFTSFRMTTHAISVLIATYIATSRLFLLSLMQRYGEKLHQTKFFGLEFFHEGGGNILIINMLKNLFLLIFHSADNQ